MALPDLTLDAPADGHAFHARKPLFPGLRLRKPRFHSLSAGVVTTQSRGRTANESPGTGLTEEDLGNRECAGIFEEVGVKLPRNRKKQAFVMEHS